ncbi:MAG: hypothetical protein ACKO5R_04950 [Planctomycetaceae bacterium]
MSSPVRHVPSRWLLRAFGLGVALLLTAAGGSRAQASCGDWLDGHSMDAHGAAVTSEARPLHGAPRPMTPPAPCSGPACRRAPVLPPAPGGAPVTPLDFDSDAVLPAEVVPPAASPALLSFADQPHLSAALRDRPERPPRGV